MSKKECKRCSTLTYSDDGLCPHCGSKGDYPTEVESLRTQLQAAQERAEAAKKLAEKLGYEILGLVGNAEIEKQNLAAAQGKIAGLERCYACAKNTNGPRSQCFDCWKATEAKRDALSALVAKMEKNLKKYGWHHNDGGLLCDYLRHSKYKCDCGWTDALSLRPSEALDSLKAEAVMELLMELSTAKVSVPRKPATNDYFDGVDRANKAWNEGMKKRIAVLRRGEKGN